MFILKRNKNNNDNNNDDDDVMMMITVIIITVYSQIPRKVRGDKRGCPFLVYLLIILGVIGA